MRYRLRPAARIELAEIWLETAERWNADQADSYVGAIRQRLERICEFPESYPEYHSQHGIFRKAPSGEHLLFYRIDGDVIDVVHIMHNRRDFDAGLE